MNDETFVFELTLLYNTAKDFVSHIDIADCLGVSGPTVSRWLNEKSLPHKVIRETALKNLASFILNKSNNV
jgi:predicted transcriptional regulator